MTSTLTNRGDVEDINLMFAEGNLVTGVLVDAENQFDLNHDLSIDQRDIGKWLGKAATVNGYRSPYRRGDTDDLGQIAPNQRDVDITDFNALASHFDPRGDGDLQNGPLWNEGNLDGDDDIDITDFNILASNFMPGGYDAVAIPEPSSVVLLLLGLGCVMFLCCSRPWRWGP